LAPSSAWSRPEYAGIIVIKGETNVGLPRRNQYGPPIANPKTDYAADGLKKATGKPGQSSANDMSSCYVILPG